MNVQTLLPGAAEQVSPKAMLRLVAAVQELSLSRDMDSIMAVVRRAARELTGADGATFVLRDREFCHYADEDAIAPLWKGRRFPLETCISGWVMMNRQPAVIEDIYKDARIPIEAYRPTFVKSLVMVPIRPASPIGAIGNYWAARRQPPPEQVDLLQALANTTAVAMENVRIYSELEERVKARTAELEAANRELEAFSYAVSHDLAGPLRRMRAYADILLRENAEKLDDLGKKHLDRIASEGSRMLALIDDLLRLSHVSRASVALKKVNLSDMAEEICGAMQAGAPNRAVECRIARGLEAECDAGLVRIVLENLLSNAWKYSSKRAAPVIEIGKERQADGSDAFFVRDNGAGFSMEHAHHLFQPFRRLHGDTEFPGNGIGLATIARIIERHGGKVRAEAELDKGAKFFFTLNGKGGRG